MGKIWLKAPDLNKQCCACAGKAGPCSSCCTGLMYNTVSDTFETFSNSLGFLPFPATNCMIAQNVDDSNTIIGSGIILEIANTNIGPRSNALSLSLKSGDLFDLTTNTVITTNNHTAVWLATGSDIYNLYFQSYSGNTTIFKEYTVPKPWGNIVSSTNYPSLFNPGSILQDQQTGITDYALYFNNPLLIPYTTTAYGGYSAGSTARTGTTGYAYPYFHEGTITEYNPSFLTLIRPRTGVIPENSASGTLFPFIDSQSNFIDCDSYSLGLRCFPNASPPQWFVVSQPPEIQPTADLGIFGNYIDKDVQCYTSLIQTNKSIFESLTNGNRPLGTQDSFIADDPINQIVTDIISSNNSTIPTVNGIPCNASHNGETQFIDVHWRLIMHYSTNWPYQTLPTVNHSGSVRVSVTGDQCVNILMGEGGVITGENFNYINQHITGYYFQNTIINLNFINGSGMLNPIYFHDNLTQVDCPFTSLP